MTDDAAPPERTEALSTSESAPPEEQGTPPAAKPKRGAKGTGRGKSSKADAYHAVVAAMEGAANMALTVPFSPRFAVLEDSRFSRKPVLVSPGDVVVDVSEQGVVNGIIRYATLALGGTGSDILPKDADQIFRLWRAGAEPIKEDAIAAVREMSEPGYCWHRLPFDIEGAAGSTPTFDEMMGRTANAEALMAWVGGLVTPGTDRQQYVYIYGDGRNGKGRLSAFLRAVFRSAYRSESTDKPNNFWTSGLIGARIVVFPDFQDPTFPDKGFFKMLTGGDPVRVEEKGKQPFTIELQAKFMFLSNSRPALSSGAANQRRAIFCEMGPLPKDAPLIPTTQYDARLWAEGAAWLAKCRRKWQQYAETGFIQVADRSLLDDVIDTHEAPLIDMLDRWFELGREFYTSPAEMQAVLRREGMKDPRAQRPWFEFLERRYGVAKVRRGSDGARERAFKGVQVREAKKGVLEAAEKAADRKTDF